MCMCLTAAADKHGMVCGVVALCIFLLAVGEESLPLNIAIDGGTVV